MSKHYALMSVFYKDGLVKLGKKFNGLGIEILSTGGTYKQLNEQDVDVTKVSYFTEAPEIMDGRVKTLHPKIAAGILHRRDEKKDTEEMVTSGYGEGNIDYVIVNLYPFQQTIAKPDVTEEEAIENIDIGGPTMVREAAKNFKWVCVIIDPNDYDLLIAELEANNGTTTLEFRKKMATKAFIHTCLYDFNIARYMSDGNFDGIFGKKKFDCKYGENPMQESAFFSTLSEDPLSIDKFTLVKGTNPSHINLTDADRLLQTITHITATFAKNNRPYKYYAVGVKHGNACGASYGNDPIKVLQRTLKGNLRAIFGGMIITNFPISIDEAKILRTYKSKKKRNLDGIFAPQISKEAIKILKRPKGGCKMLVNPALKNLSLDTDPLFRIVRGGFLKQTNYTNILDIKHPEISKVGRLRDYQIDNILLAKAICDTSNSNTISLVKGKMLIGNGTGGTDRVGAADLALEKAYGAGHNIYGAVASSDSFFPFPDGVEVLLEDGIKVIQSISGSINDHLILKAVKNKKATLVWLPVQYGRGFFGH